MQGEPPAPLVDRVIEALNECYRQTHKLPTAGNYKDWRATLPAEQRTEFPSMTAVVPIAFPSWSDARRAAGLDKILGDNVTRGPKPSWSEQECLAWVRRWIASDSGSSLASFGTWLEERRSAGEDAPAASTVRLRLRKSWSGILAQAAAEDSNV